MIIIKWSIIHLISDWKSKENYEDFVIQSLYEGTFWDDHGLSEFGGRLDPKRRLLKTDNLLTTASSHEIQILDLTVDSRARFDSNDLKTLTNTAHENRLKLFDLICFKLKMIVITA